MPSEMTVAQAAEDLVERSNLGDQNAMALIAEVGRLSRTSNPTDENGNPLDPVRIKASFDAIMAYMKAHPVKDGFAGEVRRGTKIGYDAKRILAAFGALPELPLQPGPENGSVSQPQALSALLCKLPTVGGVRAASTAVVILFLSPLSQDVLTQAQASLPPSSTVSGFAAEILNLSSRLRAFCAGAPASVFSPSMGWEFGEAPAVRRMDPVYGPGVNNQGTGGVE
jgi:hypothetical protein